MSSSSGSKIEEIPMHIDANQNLTNLNKSLHAIEESPVKLQGLSSASQSNYSINAQRMIYHTPKYSS